MTQAEAAYQQAIKEIGELLDGRAPWAVMDAAFARLEVAIAANRDTRCTVTLTEYGPVETWAHFDDGGRS